ncbi:MAG: phosphoglycerate kinase [Puniceicoccales bacterium]|jgi:3-phosphoglycerate kinase|nr:phosphoglycerate kinase [Puniceicoccales bacterium]
MPVQTIADVDLSQKDVLVRVDFNVPLESGKIADNSRIRAALPTIEYLIRRAAKVILLSHLGRPKAQKNLKYSLRPAAQELSQLLGRPVLFLEDCLGDDVQKTIAEMGPGSVVMLENLRFYAEEEANDREFAKKLAAYGNAYVNDAFGTAHRAHASTAGVPGLLPIKVAGFLMQKELEFLGNRTANPERPFTVILGGAKVSDKIGVIDALLDKCDNMLIGGAMAYTFHLAQRKKVGNSLVEKDRVSDAQAALQKAEKRGVKIFLPADSIATDALDFEARTIGAAKTVSEDIPDGWQGVDIGPKTIEIFGDIIKKSKTIFWNGPMGIFEISACSKGTFAVAKAVAQSSGISIVGGGDSITAINKSGFSDQISFMSTGGGASLEFLEGKEMPGVAALMVKSDKH